MPEMKLQLPSTIAANIEQFTGRTWLLPTLLHWYEQTNERLFLLTGEPGTGKSMIMAWLAGAGPLPVKAEAQSQLARLRAQVKAVHFCVAASGATDPKDMARQMAEQLTRNVPGFGKALATTLGDQVQIVSEQQIRHVATGSSVTGIYIGSLNLGSLSEELSFNRILRDPLKQLYADGYDQPMLLLVDALDEAMTYSGATNIVHLLTKLTDLPQQVRFLVMTRPHPPVLYLLHEYKAFDLIKCAPASQEDVRKYVYERLVEAAGERRTLLAQRISQAAEGIFLYAYLLLEDKDLLLRLSDTSDLALIPLPTGLSGLYLDFLNRQLGKDRTRWHKTLKSVLGLIAVAQGAGLSRAQLEEILGQDIEEPVEICKQYLDGELPQGPFRPFHKSFADFLLDDEKNTAYHIDSLTMHHQIANYYWNTYHEDWQQCDLYGLRNLVSHQIACLSFLKNPADKQMQTKNIYNVVLDPVFRKAQHNKSGDGNISLNDLRHALELALARDDIVPVLKCVFAYREMLRGANLIQDFFEAVNEQAFETAQNRLNLYLGIPDWGAVAHLYLAWEAAEAGNEQAVTTAVKAARKLPISNAKELCDALSVRVTQALLRSNNSKLTISAYLQQWGVEINNRWLETASDSAAPSPVTDEEFSFLCKRLERLTERGGSLRESADEVESILIKLVTQEAGLSHLDNLLQNTLVNEYSRYRDIELVPLAIPCILVRDPNGLRARVRQILSVTLDREGMSFRFELPAMLVWEARARGWEATALATHLYSKLETEDRYWGSDERAALAWAGALFRHGQPEAALKAMTQKWRPSMASAGYATLTVLAMIDRCLEMGKADLVIGHVWPNSHLSLIQEAELQAQCIRDPHFREQRRALVAHYQEWLQQSLPDSTQLPTALHAFQDNDTRTAYINHVAARWAGSQEGPNIPALKALIVPSLNDGTTLDATLARFIGLNLSHLTDDDLNELVQLVGKSLPVD